MPSKKVETLLKEINSLINEIDSEIKTFDQKWFNHDEDYQEFNSFLRQLNFEVELELIETDWLPFVK